MGSCYICRPVNVEISDDRAATVQYPRPCLLETKTESKFEKTLGFWLTAEQHSRVTTSNKRKTEIWRRADRTFICTGQVKCDGTHAETRFRLSAKRTSPFKSAGASVQSTAGSRGVRISGSNAGYTMFRGSVKSTGYPHSIRQFPPHSPTRASPCAITFQLDSTHSHILAWELWITIQNDRRIKTARTIFMAILVGRVA